jgi:hypothetical protein
LAPPAPRPCEAPGGGVLGSLWRTWPGADSRPAAGAAAFVTDGLVLVTDGLVFVADGLVLDLSFAGDVKGTRPFDAGLVEPETGDLVVGVLPVRLGRFPSRVTPRVVEPFEDPTVPEPAPRFVALRTG